MNNILDNTSNYINNLNAKTAIILIGGSGSGKGFIKSLLVERLNKTFIESDVDNIKHIAFINGDSKALLPEKHSYFSDINKIRENCIINNANNILLDKTGKITNEIIQLVERLENKGFKVVLIFVDTHIKTMLNRIELRYKETGRNVPSEIAIQARIGSKKTYLKLKEQVKAIKIDNN